MKTRILEIFSILFKKRFLTLNIVILESTDISYFFSSTAVVFRTKDLKTGHKIHITTAQRIILMSGVVEYLIHVVVTGEMYHL